MQHSGRIHSLGIFLFVRAAREQDLEGKKWWWKMQFVLWFKWSPENTERLLALWKEFKYPKEVKVIHRYIIIGRHTSFAIFDAKNEEEIIKITAPFSSLGVAKIAPIMPLEKAVQMAP